jgi:hypothetical protein
MHLLPLISTHPAECYVSLGGSTGRPSPRGELHHSKLFRSERCNALDIVPPQAGGFRRFQWQEVSGWKDRVVMKKCSDKYYI